MDETIIVSHLLTLDRFMFKDEAFRFNSGERSAEASWERLGSGHSEAKIVEAARSAEQFMDKSKTARVVTDILKSCAVYQFHDTSYDSKLKKNCDAEENAYLRPHGGNLAAILYRLEREDGRRFNSICSHIQRALPVFDRFEIEKLNGKVMLRWKLSLSLPRVSLSGV